ncbi:MAG: glutathione S-transferase [Albidovulum sp.]
MTPPILYSFRRCPYAMRARLAIASAGITCELREIVLRDKAPELVAASPKATVPVLLDGADVIEESLDIMLWALGRNDPEGWLETPSSGFDLIAECDGPFKNALDRYKYAERHEGTDAAVERDRAGVFLYKLNSMLCGREWLFGDGPMIADMATITFVRQFAHVDLVWFSNQPWPDLTRWLNAFKTSKRFDSIMQKYPKWQAGDKPVLFPT